MTNPSKLFESHQSGSQALWPSSDPPNNFVRQHISLRRGYSEWLVSIVDVLHLQPIHEQPKVSRARSWLLPPDHPIVAYTFAGWMGFQLCNLGPLTSTARLSMASLSSDKSSSCSPDCTSSPVDEADNKILSNFDASSISFRNVSSTA